MDYILTILYIVISWWAVDKVWYSKSVYIISDVGKFYVKKFSAALFFGWLCIPIAVIMVIFKKP